MTTFVLVWLACLAVLCTTVFGVGDDLYVNITILQNATTQGAVCLDGSPPAYYLHRGFDTGIFNWIMFLQGGGWCESIFDCQGSTTTEKGSSKNMAYQSKIAGILHNNPQNNPDFYNWNRVWVNYCDGSSFIGDTKEVDPGSTKNLPPSCISAMEPSLCFFPQNVIPFVETPLFIINSAYDAWQINNTLIPSNLDPQHAWEDCKVRISDCTLSQRTVIKDFGMEFLKAFNGLTPCHTKGYFITSCHTHDRIVTLEYWFSTFSPRILNKTIAETVGDWYLDRTEIYQHMDSYPFAKDCY